MLLILQLDCAKWVSVELSQLVPTRMMLGHVLDKARVIELLNLDLFTASCLRRLIVLQAVVQCLVKIPDLMVLSIRIFDRCAIKSPNELQSGDGAFPR